MHKKRYSGEVERLRNPERIELLEVERVVPSVLDGINAQSILDIGTGSGIFAEAFAKEGVSVSGIDPNPDMLKAAQEFVPSGTFRFGTVEKIPFPDKTFDLVFLGHVLHESDDLVKALYESKRCAKQRVAILEWPYKQEESGPPLEHRLKTEEIIAGAKKVGFPQMESIQLQHMVLFKFTI
ncbi:MAG TPA: class I SAM-dependent methyltransferase [Candidatus Acidoferrales bacterium]|nr:class I SAM-dependent methyltransferase [Candidatus Acidoferrales bacterium]